MKKQGKKEEKKVNAKKKGNIPLQHKDLKESQGSGGTISWHSRRGSGSFDF